MQITGNSPPTAGNKLLPESPRWLRRMEDGLLVAVLLCMMGMAVLQILLRILFHTGVVWADGFVRLLVLWVGLLGAMSASRDDNHIRIDLITPYLPACLKRGAEGIVRAATAVICAAMAWYSFRFLQVEHASGIPAFASVPAWICELIIPVGFSVIAFRYAVLSINRFKSFSGKTIS